MPSSLKSISTAVDSWPLPATEDDKIDNVGLVAVQAGVASQERRRRVSNSRTPLGKKPVDRQDTTDSNNHDPAGQNDFEVQVDTRDSRPKPQAPATRVVNTTHPVAAPTTTTTYTASTDRDAGTETKKNKKKKKKAKNKNKKPAAEADDEDGDGDADDQSYSCLPFRRRGERHGPRKGDKDDKGGRFQKFKMGFFSRKKKSEEVNPYAAPITPYQQARAQIASGPPPPYNQSPSIGNSPSIGHSPSVGSNSRFGDEKYGNQKGYGSSPYETNASAFNTNQRGPGGYGGLDEDAGKNDLFGGASGRYVPGQQSNVAPNPNQSFPSRSDNDPSKSALLGNAQDRYNPMPQAGSQPEDEYDGYGAPRELTEEEKEEIEVQAMKDETNGLRKEGVDSTNRSLAVSRQAILTAQGTLARLGGQGDRLHNTEANLDSAAAKSRVAEDKTKELTALNGSMFAVHVGNPFTSRRRQEDADNKVLDQHRMERATREATRREAYAANQDMEQTFKEIERKPTRNLGAQRTAERSKFMFEDDEDAEEMEDAIDDNLDELGQNATILKGIAFRMGDEVSRQNNLIDRITDKSDLVDDHVRINREKLGRIK